MKDENPHPFVLDSLNKASMNGFLKASYFQMPLKLLTRPLKLSKCFAYMEVPRIILKPFDGAWERRNKIDFDEFILEEYSPIYDDRFNELFNAANNRSMISQVPDSEFLTWRYRNVPGRSYKTIISKGEDGMLNGCIIFRLTVPYGINIGFIMDFVNKNDSENRKFLICYPLRYFWNNDAPVVAAICFPNCVENHSLRKEGFLFVQTAYVPILSFYA